MQVEKVQQIIAESGHSTQLEVCALSNFNRSLKKILPQGKVLILLEESIPLQLFKGVQEQVNFYKQYVLFLEENESLTALFSLPDDIRMVIAIGKKAVKLGRIFATLRNCYSVAIAVDYDASTFFVSKIENVAIAADAKIDVAEKLYYPVQPLTLILLDTTLLQDKREGILKLASCTLIAVDIELDALFRGESTIKSSLPKLDIQNNIELYFAAILEGLTLAQCSHFSYLNVQAILQDNVDTKFNFFCYFIDRYQQFFQKNLRKYYIPNYLLRYKYAMQYFGKAISLKNVEVFSAAKSKQIAQIFEQSKFTFMPYIQLLHVYSTKLQAMYKKVAKSKLVITPEEEILFSKLYNISAESTNLYLPPLLEREFGLLELPK